jgi:hypothetical protein
MWSPGDRRNSPSMLVVCWGVSHIRVRLIWAIARLERDVSWFRSRLSEYSCRRASRLASRASSSSRSVARSSSACWSFSVACRWWTLVLSCW